MPELPMIGSIRQQTRNIATEGCGGEINSYMLCVPLRPPRLFFLPESAELRSGDQSTYLSSYGIPYITTLRNRCSISYTMLWFFYTSFGSSLFMGVTGNPGAPTVWRKSGACSHLEPVYEVPHSYLRPGYEHGYSTNLSAIEKNQRDRYHHDRSDCYPFR